VFIVKKKSVTVLFKHPGQHPLNIGIPIAPFMSSRTFLVGQVKTIPQCSLFKLQVCRIEKVFGAAALEQPG
jgi:hypothetical protein